MTTVETLLQRVPSGSPAILVPGGPELSYADLLKAVATFKADLETLGFLKCQAAVSISLPNSLEFAVAFLAVTGSSLIAAPLNPAYKQSEFEFYIDDMKSDLVIVPAGSIARNYPAVAAAKKFGSAIAEVHWDGSKVVIDLVSRWHIPADRAYRPPISLPREPKLRNPKPRDIAFVLHTSGTTGRPKAVPLLHRNMLASLRNIVGTYKLSSADRGYLVMPLFHVHGLMCGLISVLGSGGSVVITPKFSASEFWKDFANYKCNWYTAVPTIHQILLRHPVPNPLPYIRFIRSCSSSLAPSTFHELEDKFKAPVIEAYAMTEACHQMTSNSLPPDIRKPGTVGIGHGVEVVILDSNNKVLGAEQEGEISCRGANVTPGYLNNAKANAEAFTAGYFRTGDQGKLGRDGQLVITGRIKELIIRGGENISPIELDSILLSHPAVSEAVAFGAPDEMYGQQVNAVVVLKSGQKATEKELQDHVAEKVAKYKVPTRIFFTDIMPKTATGKIQRRIIAQKFVEPKPKL